MLDFARYLAGLVLVLGLLAGFAFILRRGYAQGLIPGLPGQASERRMRVVETLMIDPRRRVVIVAVDETEHVLVLGAERETVLAQQPARPKFTPEMPGGESESQ